MATPGKKLHSISKSERLCNFTFKNILFDKGNVINAYPLKVFWTTLDINLEPVFFSKSITEYQGVPEALSVWKTRQNPSFPQKKIPANAFFTHPAKVMFGVSKKVQKKATDRNHLKRLIKEAYRQNKAPMYTFLDQMNQWCLIAIIYTAKPIVSYHEIEAKIIVSLQKIEQQIKTTTKATH
jgi:ribonuclease P protein component